jgi:hypothetical protein
LVDVSGVEGSVIVAIGPPNGNQDRCHPCIGSFWKRKWVKAVEGYS